jgi:hypothetical protein
LYLTAAQLCLPLAAMEYFAEVAVVVAAA